MPARDKSSSPGLTSATASKITVWRSILNFAESGPVVPSGTSVMPSGAVALTLICRHETVPWFVTRIS